MKKLKLNKKQLVIGGIVVLVVAAGLVVMTRKPSPAPVAFVEITADSFVPATIQVKAGTKVIWTNKDGAPHKVASGPYPEQTDLPGLISGDLGPGASYSFTFTDVGTFGYYDEAHLTSSGTVIVR